MPIVLSNLSSDSRDGFFDASVTAACDGRERRLTLRRFGNHPKFSQRIDTFDPFATALLLPAMLRGEALQIAGTVDELLLESLRGPVQDTLRLLEPRWRKVPVEASPRPATDLPDLTLGAATAMSGGVDSLHLIRHQLLRPGVPACRQVQTLLHHHVGAHGDDAAFAEQLRHNQQIADRLGLPLVGTICQLDDLYQSLPFVTNAALRNVAASMAVDHLFSAFHYASSEPIGGRPVISRLTGIGTLEPQLLPLFNTPRVSWLAFGGAATRLQKTAEVLADDSLCHQLLVCIRGSRTDRRAINCGRCYKCSRLLLQAEASGRLDAVAAAFDMAAFRAGRSHAIGRLLRFALGPARSRVDADLIAFLVERRFPFPWWARPGVGLVLLASGNQHSLAAVD
jgi:hypothetical protein